MHTNDRSEIDTLPCLHSVDSSWYDAYWYSPAIPSGRSRLSALFSCLAAARLFADRCRAICQGEVLDWSTSSER